MKRDVLKKLVSDGHSIRTIAVKVGLSYTGTRWWLAKYDLKTKVIRPHLCVKCGETDPTKFYGDRKTCCKVCFVKTDAQISLKKKLRAVKFMGNKCSRCGYNKFYGALEFHRIDKTDKRVWNSLRNWGWPRIVKELKKCVMLCANCHREVHSAEPR